MSKLGVGGQHLVVAALGATQTLGWASSYYLPAILADPIARDLGGGSTSVFAAFSSALLLSAVLGPRIGRSIDRFGGRKMLALSNLVFAAGLVLLAMTTNRTMLWIAWLVMGLGMGAGLYDAAFATLGRIYGSEARRAITGVTLIAGFASTVGWPLTAWLEAHYGWRAACAVWAGAHLLIGLPINLFAIPRVVRAESEQHGEAERPVVVMDRNMLLLGFALAAGWFVSVAMASHLPRVLEAAGATSAYAIAAGAFVGPSQVAARLVEASVFSRFNPLLSARLAMLAHPIGVALLLGSSGLLAIPFAILHGAGNGILTIARGTVPLFIYGPVNYGYRLGLLGAPARMLQALSPLVFGLLIDRWGGGALVVSAIICLAAMGAFFAVGPQRAVA